MSERGKIEIEVKDIIGVAKPFPQGGVWRLTIPKKVVKECDLEFKRKKGKFFAFIFLKTNKGLLLLPLDKVANPENVRGALMKFIDISHLDERDLEIVMDELKK